MKPSKIKTILTSSSYIQLLNLLKDELVRGRQRAKRAVEKEKLITYRRMGGYISKDILENKQRAGYGEHLFDDLSKDLDIGKCLLHQIVQFSQAFPIVHARAQLE